MRQELQSYLISSTDLWVEQVRVYDSSLDIVEVGVVFEGTLQESGFLAQLSDVRAVVMREHLVTQDGVGNLQGKRNVSVLSI